MDNFTIIFAFLFVTFYAHGDLADHFKKCSEKTTGHSMENIDFIYMINLDERPEKYEETVARFEPYGIYPFRFSAVNGWKLSAEEINSVGVKFNNGMKKGVLGSFFPDDDIVVRHDEIIEKTNKTYFSYKMPIGSIGIVLSHLSILQDAYDSGYDTIWVMEDDIEPVTNPHEISELIVKLDQIDPNWDILFTDIDTKHYITGEYIPCLAIASRVNLSHPDANFYLDSRRVVSEDFTFKLLRYGAYSMIVRRSAMEKILKFYKEHSIFLPYDTDFFYAPGMRLYSCNRDIVSFVPGSPSDNGSPNYEAINQIKLGKAM